MQVPCERCSQCQVVLYCSRRCEKEQWPNLENICQAIKVLTQRENSKSAETAFVSHLTPTQHGKMFNLVGVLTQAQLSIMTQAMLEETLPGTTAKDISKLINVGLDLTAANGTKIHWLSRHESTTSITDK